MVLSVLLTLAMESLSKECCTVQSCIYISYAHLVFLMLRVLRTKQQEHADHARPNEAESRLYMPVTGGPGSLSSGWSIRDAYPVYAQSSL